MPRIAPCIASLSQPLQTLQQTPGVYRPPACPHCGLDGLWGHGCYERKAGRSPDRSDRLNPLPIPRFFCQGCGHTCSRLPECIAPRRWYGWAAQQPVLQLLLVGCSLRRCSARVDLDRRTVRRWREGLKRRGDEFSLFPRGHFPELGRAVDFRSFCAACLERMSPGEAMAWLDRDGVVVP